jgi:hypothetical protein
MSEEQEYIGYVILDDGTILVQVLDDNRWGFVLADEDQSWEGGFGLYSSWEPIADDDPRITAQRRSELQGILDNVSTEESETIETITYDMNGKELRRGRRHNVGL